MTETDPWHAPPSLLARFAGDPAALDDATASSLEGHLVACSACRMGLVSATAGSVLAASWEAVADRVDRPRRSVVERALERLGMRGGLARLVGATPALQVAGLGLIAVMAVAAAVVSRSVDARGPFLALAPLVPLAGVAATFAAAADPAGEAGVATPLHGAGLALRRAALVVGSTFALLGLAGLAVPGLGLESAAWMLPALALALGSLALGTWWRIEVCGAGLALAWVAAISWAWVAHSRHLDLGDTALFGTTGQLAALVAVLLATAVIAARSDRFATLEARS